MTEPLTPRALLHVIIAQVAREYGLLPEQIKARNCRVREVQYARAVIASRLFDHGMSLQKIGRVLVRDRAQVLRYLRKVPPRKEETDHDNEQAGTEGNETEGAAGGAGRRQQAADRQEGQGQGDWQGHQHQGGEARRAVT